MDTPTDLMNDRVLGTLSPTQFANLEEAYELYCEGCVEEDVEPDSFLSFVVAEKNINKSLFAFSYPR